MRDDIPGEDDTEFQRELYRTKLAHQHEIALLRIRNKHELRALRVHHAHKAEIVRAVGWELRDILSLYSGGLLQLCTFLGPDHSAEPIASITHRTACMVERVIETYVTGSSGKADAAHGNEERDDEGGDEWGGDGGCMNCDDPDCEGFSYDPREDRDRWAPYPSDALNVFELRSGILHHPMLGDISGINALLRTLPNMAVCVEARSLPESLEDGPLQWLDPVAKEDLETWRPLAEYTIRDGRLVGRGGITTADAELARFQDCLLRVSTRPSSAPSDVTPRDTEGESAARDTESKGESDSADTDLDEDDLGTDQTSATEDLQALCAQPASSFTMSDEVRTKGFGGPPDRD